MEVSFDEDPVRWDDFVRRSPQRSPYVTTAFLRALGAPFELVTCRRDGIIVAGAPLILDDNGRAVRHGVPMTMYQGILLADSEGVPAHRRIGQELEAMTILVSNIADRHQGCHLSQSWRLRDVRALSWHNYHAPEKGRFSISIAYTGILDLSRAPHEEYVRGIRELRRREWKRARDRVVITQSNDLDLLEELYVKTLARQGIERSARDRVLLRRIAEGALSSGYGELRIASVNGRPASSLLFLYDDRSAFYFFGANDPELRASGASTYLMLENIRNARERGLAEVDFVGVNSPQRGDYKVSFNAEIFPYYVARLAGDG